MPRRARLSPEAEVYFDLVREQMRTARRIEAIRSFRNIWMSRQQAGAFNGAITAVDTILLGAFLGGVANVAKKVEWTTRKPKIDNHGEITGYVKVEHKLDLPTVGLAGKVLLALGGAEGGSVVATDVIKALRGAPTSLTLAVDNPDNEGPAALGGEALAAAAAYFPRSAEGIRRQVRKGARSR